ncbi:MAG: hypothetical protein CMK09_00985 [Ponticaulis sp.]|nr:hypothetical protein [Ponticaulis sp.]|tara:strand:+ start:16708 stop:17694 length:987 start_codon:yes stop_codon:yes gene_type:complete
MSATVLVGDVGGTNVRLAKATGSIGSIALQDVQIYTDPAIVSLDDAIARYADEQGGLPDRALFALAGPISSSGSIKLTNRDWPQVNPDLLRSKFKMSATSVVNDFAAMARGIPEIPQSSFETVIEGRGQCEQGSDQTVLVTGPGTGMGVSTLRRTRGKGWQVITGEGGHVAFAPRNEREMAIRDIISRTHGFVSVEMIVSGRWLRPVYEAICELHGAGPEDLSPQSILDRADKGDAICTDVCTFRANALMGAVGDAAMITGATSGVVMTGGVAKRMVKWLRLTEAIDRFRARGLMSFYLGETPLSVLKNDEAPLIGAAALALEMESQS